MTLVQHSASIGRDQANNCVKCGGLACAVRAKKSNDFALLDRQADTIYNAAATVRFANFFCGQGTHLSCHSRLCYHRSTCFAFYEHPIIAPEESQRNASNPALFGIKNARRSASQYKPVVGDGINQLLSGGSPRGLLDDHVVQGNHVVELSGTCKRLTIRGLTTSQEIGVGGLGGGSKVRSPGNDSAFVVNSAL